MPPLNVDINISQGPIIFALNEWLASSRVAEETKLKFSEAGVCHGLAALSCAVDDLREKIIKLVKASKDVSMDLSSEEWHVYRWFADFLPASHDPENTFENNNFLKLPQTSSYLFSSLDVLGQYTTVLNIRKLSDAFKLLNTPCQMIFYFNNHAIKVKYNGERVGFYDPNNPNKHSPDLCWYYDNHTAAAREILKVFATTQDTPQTITNETAIAVHIVIVKKQSETLNPPEAFMNRLRRIDSFSLNKTDLYDISLREHAIVRKNDRHIPGVTPRQYLETFQNLGEQIYLRHIDLDVILSLLDRTNPNFHPFFLERLIQDPYIPQEQDLATVTRLKDIVDRFHQNPDIQRAATAIYVLIKQKGKNLDTILEEEFYRNADLRTLSIMSSLGLRQLSQKTSDIYVKKTAAELLARRVDDSFVQLNAWQNPDMAHALTLLNTFYFGNNLAAANVYIAQFANIPFFVFYLCDFVVTHGKFSILDNKPAWLQLFLGLSKKHKLDMEGAWLTQALFSERREMFAGLAQQAPWDVVVNTLPIVRAAEHNGAEFLTYILDFFNGKDVLGYLIDQSNENGENALHIAAFKGKTAHVKLLLQFGANALLSSALGETPLFLACARGHTDIAEAIFRHLIQKNVGIGDSNGALFSAARNSINPNMLQLLVNLYAECYSRATIEQLLPPNIVSEFFPVAQQTTVMPTTLEVPLESTASPGIPPAPVNLRLGKNTVF